MGELPLHVTLRDDRPLSAPFTLTASMPGLERWDKPAVFTFVYICIVHEQMYMYTCM